MIIRASLHEIGHILVQWDEIKLKLKKAKIAFKFSSKQNIGNMKK
jgi:hypothetical protein